MKYPLSTSHFSLTHSMSWPGRPTGHVGAGGMCTLGDARDPKTYVSNSSSACEADGRRSFKHHNDLTTPGLEELLRNTRPISTPTTTPDPRPFVLDPAGPIRQSCLRTCPPLGVTAPCSTRWVFFVAFSPVSVGGGAGDGWKAARFNCAPTTPATLAERNEENVWTSLVSFDDTEPRTPEK